MGLYILIAGHCSGFCLSFTSIQSLNYSSCLPDTVMATSPENWGRSFIVHYPCWGWTAFKGTMKDLTPVSYPASGRGLIVRSQENQGQVSPGAGGIWQAEQQYSPPWKLTHFVHHANKIHKAAQPPLQSQQTAFMGLGPPSTVDNDSSVG